ncbi:MAG TPA: hypothetical protein VGO96_19040 [Pyrinomonadaceae bacterium]|jgi:hypothetical protein|nr:hypothetical protein [Pyrinomonadaceae bacterium]
MKRTPLVLNRLIIASALATQLFVFAPATQAVTNTSSLTTFNMQHENHDDHNTRQRPRRNRCRERCQRQYRQCTRGIVGPKAARCRQRYNQCLRSCRY